MVSKYRDTICGVCIMVVAVILFIATFYIRSLLGMKPGPEFMPRVASILLFIVAAGIAVDGLRAAKDYVPKELTEEEKGYKKAGNRKVLYSAILIGFYCFAMNSLGFVISTIIYEFCQMVVLTEYGKKKNYVLFAVIAVVTAFLFYYVFTRVLYLMLPPGVLRHVGL